MLTPSTVASTTLTVKNRGLDVPCLFISSTRAVVSFISIASSTEHPSIGHKDNQQRVELALAPIVAPSIGHKDNNQGRRADRTSNKTIPHHPSSHLVGFQQHNNNKSIVGNEKWHSALEDFLFHLPRAPTRWISLGVFPCGTTSSEDLKRISHGQPQRNCAKTPTL